ncbi:uncharacterized protein LOC117106931, partial [Anneissia japonica]|uniref:uncharacterized protein LOC117106931 n=1 Tax=Anneissia japonica TaxID=1529436 RepID=UPI0014255CCC
MGNWTKKLYDYFEVEQSSKTQDCTTDIGLRLNDCQDYPTHVLQLTDVENNLTTLAEEASNCSSRSTIEGSRSSLITKDVEACNYAVDRPTTKRDRVLSNNQVNATTAHNSQLRISKTSVHKTKSKTERNVDQKSVEQLGLNTLNLFSRSPQRKNALAGIVPRDENESIIKNKLKEKTKLSKVHPACTTLSDQIVNQNSDLNKNNVSEILKNDGCKEINETNQKFSKAKTPKKLQRRRVTQHSLDVVLDGVSSSGTDIEVYIDGPYGAPSQHIFQAEHAVLIGAGIGVTPFASILQSIHERYKVAKRICPNCKY